ncbi:uncharacterized protein [Oscarella lobularis]|uniref:uncharacterized protein n=1 Tax=Oscarella lobularis TaxID=121494 RepID=UPI003313F14F
MVTLSEGKRSSARRPPYLSTSLLFAVKFHGTENRFVDEGHPTVSVKYAVFDKADLVVIDFEPPREKTSKTAEIPAPLATLTQHRSHVSRESCSRHVGSPYVVREGPVGDYVFVYRLSLSDRCRARLSKIRDVRVDKEKEFTRICVGSSRSLVQCGDLIEKTENWINFDATIGLSSVLTINGMIKSGKSTWLNVVLPGLIKKHPKYGVDSNHPAIIWKLNLEKLDCSTPGHLMVDIIVDMNKLAEMLRVKLPHRSTIRNADDYKSFLERHSGRDYLMDLLKGLEALTAESEHPLFILIDEVQRFFFWPAKEGGLDQEKVSDMRWVYKNLVTFGEPGEPYKVRFAVTGSCMMSALVNIHHCPTRGTDITIYQLDLPCSVPAIALNALCNPLPSPLEKEVMNFCSRSPALMIHLMDKFYFQKKAAACIDPVSKFCFDEIEGEIAAKLWARNFPFLQDLDINERLLLRSVGLDFQGVPRSALYNSVIFEGLYKHLEPFLRPVRTVSLEEGESASTPKEEHVYVACVPFQAFVTSAISSSGILPKTAFVYLGTVKDDLFYHLFRSVMLDFGECLINEIDAGNANDTGSPLNKPLDDIVEQCKSAGLSLDDLKNCALCDYIGELEECGLRKVQGISTKYSVLKDHLPKKFNHRDVCRSIIVSLKNALVHTATEREHVQKLLPLLPFKFFEALPLIQTACEDVIRQ